MQIGLEAIRLTHVRVPLHEPFVISSGAVADKDAVLVELMTAGGVGLGEASPMAGTFYSGHTPETTWAVLTERIVPLLGGANGMVLSGLAAAMAECGDPFACCGIETAVWDAVARTRGVSLSAMLGGTPGVRPDSGLAVGIYDDVETLLARIGQFVEQGGYRRVKIKVQPGWDVEPLRAVRRIWPDLVLTVDANAAYTADHIEHLCAWDEFSLAMIEQPFATKDLATHAELAKRCCTPICLDESATDAATVIDAIERGACGIVNIKLQRVGGFAAALAVHDAARDRGVGCWVGTMPELAVGGWAAAHFATLPNIRYPTDVEASDRWFVADVTTPTIRCEDGCLTIPDGPGLGVTLNADIVRQFAVRSCEVRLGATIVFDGPVGPAARCSA
ncbi:MAG: o-succinylbenzoate synthase [Phycisphaerae bacterium]|nr:o-succinylbenzoate synthase [Phycisphaerae bacterium]